MAIRLTSLKDIDLMSIDPVVTHICNEPKGDVERSIRLMPITPDNLYHFWDRAKIHKTLFFEEIHEDFTKFLNLILYNSDKDNASAKGLFWVMDDFVGMFYMTDIIPGEDAAAHFVFFDGRFKGRTGLAREMLYYIFNQFKFNRLSVRIPVYVRPVVVSFVKELGFQVEGKLMKKTWFDNKWFDLLLLGLLKENFLRSYNHEHEEEELKNGLLTT